MSFVFSSSIHFRKRIYTNIIYMLAVLVLFVCNLGMLLHPNSFINSLMGFGVTVPVTARFQILAAAVANFLASNLVEALIGSFVR